MRNIEPGLAAHLASGVTTLCTCWRIVRRDGAILCFTDHDRDLAFDSCTFAAGAGIDASASDAALGLASGGSEIAGVFSSGAIMEHDLVNGAFDGARVEIWRVNWADVSQRVLLDIQTIGEFRRTGESFTAELRSMAASFDQETGRLYHLQCDADLGDENCGVDIDAPSFKRVASVSGGDGHIDIELAATNVEEGLFDGGGIEFGSGANAGVARAIDNCTLTGSGARVRLWERLPRACVNGDEVILRAGCDKRFATCRDRFGNQLRFRGFPHMPGMDALLMHVDGATADMDGGSLFS